MPVAVNGQGVEGGQIFLASVVNTTFVRSYRDSSVGVSVPAAHVPCATHHGDPGEVAQRGRAEDVAHLLPKYSSTSAAVHAAQPYVLEAELPMEPSCSGAAFYIAWAVSYLQGRTSHSPGPVHAKPPAPWALHLSSALQEGAKPLLVDLGQEGIGIHLPLHS